MGQWPKEAESKFQTKQTFGATGIIGLASYNVFAENQLRVVVEGVGGGNSIDVQGKIRNATAWDTLDTIVGPSGGVEVDISTYDEVRFDCTAYAASGTPTLIVAGFFEKAPGPVVPGEANTASNQGAGGLGFFDTKVGVDLQFKNLNVGSAKLTLTSDVPNKEIDIDLDESQVDHNSLNNLATGDVHTQYVNKNGRAGGQVVNGGTAASENLDLRSTAHATKGAVLTDNLMVQNALQTLASDNATAGALNDVATTGTSFLRLTAATSVTGFADGSDGKRLVIKNATAANLVILNESASSSASNRIQSPTGADIDIAPNSLLELIYDATAARWAIESFDEAYSVRNVAGNININPQDNLLLVDTSAPRSLTLPVPNSQLKFTIKDKTGQANTNPITLVRNAAENIEMLASDRLFQQDFGFWTIVSDGTDWWII